MKILVNDYAGHAFSYELARRLAHNGHAVVYAYFFEVSGPRGAMEKNSGDPANLSIVPISVGQSFHKYDYLRRIRCERNYAGRVATLARREKIDAILVSNTPDDVLDILRRNLPQQTRIVYWAQDIYSMGIRAVLNRKLPFVGTLAGMFYRAKERRFANRADHIVAITNDFIPFFDALGVPRNKISVIENWAALDEILPLSRENDWKREHGLANKMVVLYSGTLGLKHNPALLVAAAQALRSRQDVRIVVISEGRGADYLAERKVACDLSNMILLPWQPYERLSEALSSGDILTAIIEEDAAFFSVPSKILSGLCVGRPLVASIPFSNLAARTIVEAQAGLVSEPGDIAGFITNLQTLLDDADKREQMGKSARRYAEKAFAIEPIASRFEQLLQSQG